MGTCTFFGHRDCPDSIKPKLREILIRLITEESIDRFLVGNQGKFDAMVYSVLCELRSIYPHISVAVVLAYMPTEATAKKYGADTIFPEGIETAPKRYAIFWRNKWLTEQAQYVVTYITRPFGGAAQFAELARSRGKRVLDVLEE